MAIIEASRTGNLGIGHRSTERFDHRVAGDACALQVKQKAGTAKCRQEAVCPTFLLTMSGIVIYEENDLMSGLLKEWLTQAGYRVREAAPRAVQRADAEDLVIASISSPRQAGAQMLRDIQAAHPGTPLIAISGQFRSGLCATGSTAQLPGAEQLLAKPLTRGELLAAVRAIIGTPS